MDDSSRKGKNVCVESDNDIFDLNQTYYESDSISDNETTIKEEDMHMQQTDHNDICTSKEFSSHCGYDIDGLSELTEDEVRQLTFTSEADADKFYRLYGMTSGFSVHKDTIRYDVKNNNFVKSRKWVCSREGERRKSIVDEYRKREPKALTRVNCRATFRILFDKQLQLYVVADFVKDHTHPLTLSHSHFFRSNRNIKSSDKATVFGMRKVGFKTSHVMDYMVNLSGGYRNVGFIKRDLYNQLDRDRRARLKHGDAECALAYLAGKADNDPLFYYRYDVDDENKLRRLFWTDSNSRHDYRYFGDVLALDATYKTNVYKTPLVLLIGVNNHYQTTLFGAALIINETCDSYIWVLEQFLDAMNNRKPISVITDGDCAMLRAIKDKFSCVKHRLCKWHLGRNCVANVHIHGFGEEFEKVMSCKCTPEEFESKWKVLTESYKVHHVDWIKEIYKKRHKWAEAYLQGQYFAGMKSTSRSESINAFFERSLNSQLRLHEFISAYDRALRSLRENNVEANSNDINTSPHLSTALLPLERHASEVYTRAMFFKFRAELKKEAQLFLVDHLKLHSILTYFLGQYTKTSITWWVEFDSKLETIKCSCLKFESVGIPCSHMIHVMKVKHLIQIPQSCIMKRWTKNAVDDPDVDIINEDPCKEMTSIEAQTARYGILSTSCNQMNYYASFTREGYNRVRSKIARITSHVKDLWVSKSRREQDDDEPKTPFGVRDPDVVKGKQNIAHEKHDKPIPRRCGKCRSIGHTKRTGPVVRKNTFDHQSNLEFDDVDEEMSFAFQNSTKAVKRTLSFSKEDGDSRCRTKDDTFEEIYMYPFMPNNLNGQHSSVQSNTFVNSTQVFQNQGYGAVQNEGQEFQFHI